MIEKRIYSSVVGEPALKYHNRCILYFVERRMFYLRVIRNFRFDNVRYLS